MARIIGLVVIILTGAAAAGAQTVTTPARLPGRGFIVINTGYQMTTNDFSDGATFEANAEDAQFTASYKVRGGPSFDVAGGVLLWHRLGAGVGVSRFRRSTPSSLTGSVPHPFFFNRARPVSGDISSLRREELAVHIQARFIALAGPRLQVLVFGGPTYFQVKQGVVTTFTWDDDYPYDDATFRTATTAVSSASTVGFNAGADVAYFFTRGLGVGGTVQFATADVNVPAAGGNTKRVTAGGTQVGVGMRVRF